MDVFELSDYKEILRLRLKELKPRRQSLTFKKVAEHLNLQSTYLSKVLNTDTHHLSEDDLFVTCKLLEFLAEETDYILLLRSYAVSQKADRKKSLLNTIDRLKSERKLNTETKPSSSSSITNEMEYLFNPHLLILHVALMSKTLRKDTRAIAQRLGLRAADTKQSLKTLERLNLIKIDPEDPYKVSHVETWRAHFHKDHPLMRVGQNLLRQMCQARLATTPEEEKHSMNFTFTMDEHGFAELKKEFNVFLKKAEQISMQSRHSEVYQLNFDLFKWL